MISFESDYTTGAHPRLLQRLAETNMEVLSGYGKDIYCETARKKIQEMCACPDADVFFLIGGTQTNAVVISSMLREYEGVIAAKTGHVSLHEAGAIEITGHKVLELSQVDGKLEASVIKQFLEQFYKDENHEHMVFPGMVYVSYPTEYGTLYTKKELTDISKVCKEYEVPLFLDGARLGYGLMSREADLSLEDIAELCDVFYIGGTKVGALCGEAVVFTKNNMPKHFVNHVKRHGALMAKGRLLGVQFDALFTDGLYFEISKNAIDMAEKMKDIFKEKGYRFYMESPTNQQFFIIENERLEKLKEKVRFGFWEKYDETHTVVRFASSWSTTEEDLKQLREIL
jgi:threonine aldolase